MTCENNFHLIVFNYNALEQSWKALEEPIYERCYVVFLYGIINSFQPVMIVNMFKAVFYEDIEGFCRLSSCIYKMWKFCIGKNFTEVNTSYFINVFVARNLHSPHLEKPEELTLSEKS